MPLPFIPKMNKSVSCFSCLQTYYTRRFNYEVFRYGMVLVADNSCRRRSDYPRQGKVYEVVEQKAKGRKRQQKSVGG